MSTEITMVVVIVGVVFVGSAALTIFLAVRLLRARKLLRDAGVPPENKLAFWGALIYLISPVDLLPDPVLLDDIGVLLLALRSLHSSKSANSVRRP
ncbi:YkvA family protein [Streptomyces apocyni]|uniref:YkvA family protein n=1 Tax=Streptomyces apocyni TaxID=2654677 RepID=UPI0012EA9654|nr:YkvA family protein [Streptomyces apocyni]